MIVMVMVVRMRFVAERMGAEVVDVVRVELAMHSRSPRAAAGAFVGSIPSDDRPR